MNVPPHNDVGGEVQEVGAQPFIQPPETNEKNEEPYAVRRIYIT